MFYFVKTQEAWAYPFVKITDSISLVIYFIDLILLQIMYFACDIKMKCIEICLIFRKEEKIMTTILKHILTYNQLLLPVLNNKLV